MQKNKLPGQQLSDLPDDFVQETVKSLKQLNDMGRPETDAEVQERINNIFSSARIQEIDLALRAYALRYISAEQPCLTGLMA